MAIRIYALRIDREFMKKSDYIIFLSLFILFLIYTNSKSKDDSYFTSFPFIAYEYYHENNNYIESITSISLSNNSVKYLILYKNYENSPLRAFLSPDIVALDNCKIIDENNWECIKKDYSWIKMIKGKFIAYRDDKKINYSKVIYWLGISLYSY